MVMTFKFKLPFRHSPDAAEVNQIETPRFDFRIIQLVFMLNKRLF